MTTPTRESEQFEFFVEQYRRLDSEELIGLQASGLTEVAQRAADHVLRERGVDARQQEVTKQAHQAEQVARTAWVSGRKPMPFDPRQAIARAFRGEEPLARVFWGYNVLGAFALAFVLGLLAQIHVVIGFAAFAIYVVFLGWIVVSLWRCARNVTPRFVWCGALVQALLILQVGGFVLLSAFAMFMR